MKEINVEDAASWDDEEARLNIEYLSVRGRMAEVNRVKELRGEPQPEADMMDMTKAELLAMAEERGLDASDHMTKAEIIDLFA